MARQHIEKVWEATITFLELLLLHLTDADTCENIFQDWLHPIMEEKLNSSYGKLDELLEVHKDYPMTTNTNFIDNIKMPQKDKSKTNMDLVAAEVAFCNMNAYYDVCKVCFLSKNPRSLTNIIEVALNLFTDNVPTLAIQGPIIREVPNIFCPTAVVSMDPDVVKRIAGETEEKTHERQAILRKLRILENGALICKRYAKRPHLGMYYPNFSQNRQSNFLSWQPFIQRDRYSKGIKW